MESIKDKLKSNRPHLSDSSIKTYCSCLNSLHKQLHPDEEIVIGEFDDVTNIINHLKDIPYNKRKTCLAALVVLTGELKFNELMMADIKTWNNNELLQKKDGKFEENMIPKSEVDIVINKAAVIANLLYKKPDINTRDMIDIQNYILLCLTTGKYIAPRRSQDWEMKYQKYDDKVENYVDMKKKQFVFNKYKTSKTYGQQIVEIPNELFMILKKYIKFLDIAQDYLLFNNKGNPLNQTEIAHKLNNIFGKKISTSMLRHVYITDKYENVDLKAMTETATEMGNSVNVLMRYIKNK